MLTAQLRGWRGAGPPPAAARTGRRLVTEQQRNSCGRGRGLRPCHPGATAGAAPSQPLVALLCPLWPRQLAAGCLWALPAATLPVFARDSDMQRGQGAAAWEAWNQRTSALQPAPARGGPPSTRFFLPLCIIPLHFARLF